MRHTRGPKHAKKQGLLPYVSIVGTLSLVASAFAFMTPATASAQTYSYTGGPQIYVVPEGVTSVFVTLNGAQGGSPSGGGVGGLGATLQAEISVNPGEVLMLNVGGDGTNNGGWNGGGRGAGTGGGASDIRRPTGAFNTVTSCAYTLSCGFSERLVVAGGGGGGGWAAGVSAVANGGDAGEVASAGSSSNLAGGDAAAGGGASTSGGISGTGSFSTSGQGASAGTLGLGAASAWVASATGGGGGGGYFGGGSGGVSQDTGSPPQADGVGGGGGGSSWAAGNGVSNAVFTSGTTQGNGSILIDPPSAIPNAAFGFTGQEQFYQVPADVDEIAIRLYGAGAGAQGDIVYGRLTVSTSSVLQLNIGGRGFGNAADFPGKVDGEGGWNGGGTGQYSSGYGTGGGGGGASDVRICASPQSTVCSLSDRVVVAGGGGGSSNGAWGLAGGRGGAGINGDGANGSGGDYGLGGTLLAGGLTTGTGAATAGTLGLGGNSGSTFYGTGGGGGGLYGGAGGNGSGGGGGSSCASNSGPCDSVTNLLGTVNSPFAHSRGVNGSWSDGLAIITAMPKASTGQVSNLTSTGASISGTVNAKFLASTPKLFIGTSQATIESCASPASSCTPSNTTLVTSNSATVLSGNSTQWVSGSITGLSANTTYFYRVCAQSVVGYACGATETFSTALSITETSIPSGNTGANYSTLLTAAGGSGSYSSWALVNSSSLPSGLTLNTTSGQISGIPVTAGSSSFDIEVTDSSGGTATKTISYSFSSPPAQPAPPAPAPAQSAPPPAPAAPPIYAPQVSVSQSVQVQQSASVSVTVVGSSLSNASVALVGNSNVLSIVTSSDVALTFIAQGSLPPGQYSVSISTPGGTIVLENFLVVIAHRVPKFAYQRLTVANFSPGSSALTRPQILRLEKFMRSIDQPLAVQCVGFTMGPSILKTDTNLARGRATNVCEFLNKLSPDVAISRVIGATSTKVGNHVRRVEILVRSSRD